MSSTSRTMAQPVRVAQLVSRTIVPGRYRRAAGTWTSAGPKRKPPASRSRIAPKTLGESRRGTHSHSTLPDGAINAVTSQSERNAYSRIGGNGERPWLGDGERAPARRTGRSIAFSTSVTESLAFHGQACPIEAPFASHRRDGPGSAGRRTFELRLRERRVAPGRHGEDPEEPGLGLGFMGDVDAGLDHVPALLAKDLVVSGRAEAREEHVHAGDPRPYRALVLVGRNRREEQPARAQPPGEPPEDRLVLVARKMPDGIEGDGAVEGAVVELDRRHVGHQERCLGDVASSHLDLPGREINPCDLEARGEPARPG